ncbi:NAD(P)H quinone oxidoreductase, PIG3 family [Thamnocephalis sphaerospora]|uniref:NAD(P)H quinone oxidoreductase, PIG3 family n=1 Tax=Thamnocephalis sphaerospora TaxID=78915 RepID=A0A4P9XQ13_9FUNG|nr:NAD(P)H quinone oxidoreductase, PIG3 family [Thamnocephalis sphaerospora]|eukprot:RKP08115.1 NAD(P)H quinone oxidoreductase, PIG3 family [Thamnocephalis sphaerospora]
MEAVIVKQPGDASQLAIGTVDKPTPKPSELLVRVHACALNRMDLLQREGKYPVPPGASQVLGVEMAGIVEACGAQVSQFRPGDRVFGLMAGGAYAQYCVIDASLAIQIPVDLSFEEAAGLPEVWYTAYQALHLIAGLEHGQDVLIHAGASGVGIAAIQLARQAGARRIIVTCGSEEKIAFCKGLGATHAINYRTDSFRERVAEWTEGKGVNVLVDFVGADYWLDNIESLGLDGCMVILAFMSGVSVPEFSIAPILRKRLRIEGSTLRSRSIAYQSALRGHFVASVLPGVINGELKHVIDRTFSWRDVAEAHRYMESNQSRGKIIMTID